MCLGYGGVFESQCILVVVFLGHDLFGLWWVLAVKCLAKGVFCCSVFRLCCSWTMMCLGVGCVWAVCCFAHCVFKLWRI